MIMSAPSLAGAAWNDIHAINRVITHPAVYGEAAKIVDVEDRLVITLPGIVVGFRHIEGRIHECHQAVVPEMRGRAAVNAMLKIRDWWWITQPSDVVLGSIPETCKPAKFVMHALGFHRWCTHRAQDPSGIERNYVTYRMERPL
ncbi:hypothetical protein [Gluconobacter cerinus]|uniref:hypothetical protein n=1 Tax=Gluconobacter cerinus TaxID=38307 RepID=UPI003AB489A9